MPPPLNAAAPRHNKSLCRPSLQEQHCASARRVCHSAAVACAPVVRPGADDAGSAAARNHGNAQPQAGVQLQRIAGAEQPHVNGVQKASVRGDKSERARTAMAAPAHMHKRRFAMQWELAAQRALQQVHKPFSDAASVAKPADALRSNGHNIAATPDEQHMQSKTGDAHFAPDMSLVQQRVSEACRQAAAQSGVQDGSSLQLQQRLSALCSECAQLNVHDGLQALNAITLEVRKAPDAQLPLMDTLCALMATVGRHAGALSLDEHLSVLRALGETTRRLNKSGAPQAALRLLCASHSNSSPQREHSTQHALLALLNAMLHDISLYRLTAVVHNVVELRTPLQRDVVVALHDAAARSVERASPGDVHKCLQKFEWLDDATGAQCARAWLPQALALGLNAKQTRRSMASMLRTYSRLGAPLPPETFSAVATRCFGLASGDKKWLLERLITMQAHTGAVTGLSAKQAWWCAEQLAKSAHRVRFAERAVEKLSAVTYAYIRSGVAAVAEQADAFFSRVSQSDAVEWFRDHPDEVCVTYLLRVLPHLSVYGEGLLRDGTAL